MINRKEDSWKAQYIGTAKKQEKKILIRTLTRYILRKIACIVVSNISDGSHCQFLPEITKAIIKNARYLYPLYPNRFKRFTAHVATRSARTLAHLFLMKRGGFEEDFFQPLRISFFLWDRMLAAKRMR